MRALVGARVSHVQGPEKVSHLAQTETGMKWAAERGHEVIGTISDLGVSASISPFERADLGPWLSPEKVDEWDLLLFSKLDRLFRSTRDCVKFAEWAETNKKILVFAEDGLTLNYRDTKDKASIESMMAELFVYLGSFFAELELNRFKSRAKDGHRVLRGTSRWASGVPPLGFRIIDHPEGKGKGLDTDPAGKALLHEMANRLLDGWSFIRIAAWLNEQGTLTQMDRARVELGKEPNKRPWGVSTVVDCLTLAKTQGFKMHKRTTVLDASGEPIRMAPPTFDDDTWKQIQEAAAKRTLNRRTPTESRNPMVGVGVCGICGATLAQQHTRRGRNGAVRNYRYYRCSRTPTNCNNIFIRADTGDDLLEQTFLEGWGSRPVTRRIFIPGEDHSGELDEVIETISRLRRESDAGLIVGESDEAEYFNRMKSLIERRQKLQENPRRSSGWITEETGLTYAQAWETEDHQKLLSDAGIKFILHSGKPLHFELFVPQQEGENDLSNAAPLPTD